MAGSFLYRLLRGGFAATPDAPFLCEPGRGALSFGAIEARAAAFASVLCARGVRPDDRVVVQVEKSPDAVALYLACLRAGAVYVPLNTAYTDGEVDFALADAEPRVFVASERGAAERLASAVGARAESLGPDGQGTLAEAAALADPAEPQAERSESDTAAMLYTSGTTGRPKGALLSHRNLASNARALHRIWGFAPGDVLLHALPIFHAHGLFVALHCALLNGSPVIFQRRFDAQAVRAKLHEATVFMGVPTFYARLLALADFGRADCEGVRLFISGSAPLSETLFARFEERTGQRILERYGMTETGMLASNPLRREDGERVAGTVGFALPEVEIEVRLADGTRAAPGAVGAVHVRGPNVFAGYWKRPDKTREELGSDAFFRTGDVGALDDEGRLSLAGRSGDMIISGGFNVYPREVELCLDELTGIAESAVVGLPHADLGEAVTAFVVADPGAPALDAGAVRAAARERLAGFKCPKRVIALEALPRNAMGKVEKATLRALHARLYATDSEDEPT